MASTESQLTGTSSRSSTSSREGDHRSSEQIRRDIERQRDDLDVTTEVLQQKLAPRELVEQLWHDVRTRVGGGAGDVVDVVKRHPLPIGLIGAGIAWWIYETSSGHSTFGNGDDYDMDDELGVGSMSTGSYRTGSHLGSSSGYSSHDDDESTSSEEGWRERSMHVAQRSSDRLRTGAASARQGFDDAVDRNPLALGAACFSLGILAGIAMPASRWEARTMGDASSRVSRKAKHAATEAAVSAVEKGAHAAQSAADRVREEAERPSSSQYRGTHEGDVQGSRSGREGSSSSGSGSSSAGSTSGRPGDGGTGNPSRSAANRPKGAGGDEPDPWDPNRPAGG